MRGIMGGAVLGLALATMVAFAEDKKDKDKPDLDKIPKSVMTALKAKFPKAVIDKWTREKEAGKVMYDIEFKQDGRKFEADIFEDGTIHNWEKEIDAKDVPEAVLKAVEKKYPKARIKEIMQVTEVMDKKETLEGYEVVLVSADKKDVELMVAADGTILEEEVDGKKIKEKD